jgi:hypothetical protein
MMALLHLIWLLMFAPQSSDCYRAGANLDDRLMVINLMLK